MTFAQMRTEFLARGFDALGTTTRPNAIINAAVAEVDAAYPWPYRESSGTGTAPLSVPTLGEIDAVTDETENRGLEVVSYRNLLDAYGDLSTTGSPLYAYVAWPSGVPTVATYPVSTHTIGVQFWEIPEPLVDDTDVPAAPLRFHLSAYLSVACRMAAVETGGDPSGWASEGDRGLQSMMLALLPDQLSGQVQRTAGGDDG